VLLVGLVPAWREIRSSDGLWLRNAANANTMATRLSTGLTDLGLQLAQPTEANEVFVYLPPDVDHEIRKSYAIDQTRTAAPDLPLRLLVGHHRRRGRRGTRRRKPRHRR
jgi:threonine aldolase